ncbi:hypothetical protein QYE76_014246 [Lolium multiflorum]|uniref:Uncharacterized protein n=1 Tax=Lolium multiflorum TaxID=4521 RepID=A0AAD8X8G1_LOLMU|nr:hypothetical protein QYE76_014246 [Lolium multiflorum]
MPSLRERSSQCADGGSIVEEVPMDKDFAALRHIEEDVITRFSAKLDQIKGHNIILHKKIRHLVGRCILNRAISKENARSMQSSFDKRYSDVLVECEKLKKEVEELRAQPPMSVVTDKAGQCDCNCDCESFQQEVELHAEHAQYFETKYLKVRTECDKLKKEVECLRSQQPTIATSGDQGYKIIGLIVSRELVLSPPINSPHLRGIDFLVSNRSSMKTGLAYEAEQSAAARAEDASAVVAVAAGEASPGTQAARLLCLSDSSTSVETGVLAVEEKVDSNAVAPAEDLQGVAGHHGEVFLDPVLDADLDPFDDFGPNVQFQEDVEGDDEEEYSDDMDDNKERRDQKSRYVLKRLKGGEIRFRKRGELFCPFCGKILQKDIRSLIQHATGVGLSTSGKHRPATKAKHAAYGLFLQNYVLPGLFQSTPLLLALMLLVMFKLAGFNMIKAADPLMEHERMSQRATTPARHRLPTLRISTGSCTSSVYCIYPAVPYISIGSCRGPIYYTCPAGSRIALVPLAAIAPRLCLLISTGSSRGTVSAPAQQSPASHQLVYQPGSCTCPSQITEKLPKSISKDLNAGRRGKISLVMESEGLTVEGRYSVSPTDGRLAVTSRWKKFIDGAKLRIGSKLKVKIFRCRCDMLVIKFAVV